MYLAVGLGNPGKEYKGTRHNIGFEAADSLIRNTGVTKIIEKHQSVIGTANIGEHSLLIAKPQTFMNNSGIAVKEIALWYKIKSGHIIVIYDDADLEFGELKIRTNGGSGGHKGIESIINILGKNDFIRVRIGIGRTELTSDLAEYVLKKIPKDEKQTLEESAEKASDAVESIITKGVEFTMNSFNRGVA